MPENPRQVEGYGAVKPISSPLYLTQSVVPSLGDIQKSQGKQFMYKAMAEMFGSGMKVAKEAYLFLRALEAVPPDPQAKRAAYEAEENDRIDKELSELDKKEKKTKEEIYSAEWLKRARDNPGIEPGTSFFLNREEAREEYNRVTSGPFQGENLFAKYGDPFSRTHVPSFSGVLSPESQMPSTYTQFPYRPLEDYWQ